MKSLTLLAAVTALAAAPFAAQAQTPDGEALFTQRCAVCHEGGSGPPKSTLATHTPAQITDILTNGVMAPMASGLSDAEKGAIAAYLTKGAAPAAAPATNAPSPAAPSTTTSQTPAPSTNTTAP
jgi:mono/diheme cytochrome c family protein